MKRELALRLLRSILPDPPWHEERVQGLFAELQALAEHKYNKYEMYQPSRLFFENLYLWLQSFAAEDRETALSFVREKLIYVSREEFQQLAQLLYHDRIYQKQLDLVATTTSLPRFRVRVLAEHPELKRLQRASLYVAMSDGARIDYFRRQILEISNEQVLASYQPHEDKVKDVLNDLRKSQGSESNFDCIFLLDDFCGSGRTVLREVVTVTIAEMPEPLIIPSSLIGLLNHKEAKQTLELAWRNDFSSEVWEEINSLHNAPQFAEATAELFRKTQARETQFAGSLMRANEQLLRHLNQNLRVYFCPLLITEYAMERLTRLAARVCEQIPHLQSFEILPGAILPDRVRVGTDDEMAQLCINYYEDRFADKHTGNVMFGYDRCGLPLILHHNTPNNSLYFLWTRNRDYPLFARYERHGRENI